MLENHFFILKKGSDLYPNNILLSIRSKHSVLLSTIHSLTSQCDKDERQKINYPS